MTTTRALCATLLPVVGDLWFSPDPTTRAHAATICGRCPIQTTCTPAAAGITTPAEGVWGGIDHGVTPDHILTPRRACGTERAFLAHRRYAEDCEVCQAAHTARVDARRRARLAEEHTLGGTATGLRLHYRLGEPACALCRNAGAREQAAHRARARADGAHAWARGDRSGVLPPGPTPALGAAA